MDWNNDGKKDLITGENDGYIRIYLNTGTDPNPAFSGFTYLQANGATFDCGSYSMPDIIDWNSDGKKDVLCGNSNGRVYLLINTGTDASPVFDFIEYLENGTGLLDVGTTSSPAAVDWNRDGKKDLLVGEYSGRIFYFENKGTDADPVFNGFLYLFAGGGLIDVETYSHIDVMDWDSDGVMDLISGFNNNWGPPHPKGGVLYFHAKGHLSVGENTLSAAKGGKAEFSLKAGTVHAGRAYILLGSVTGTSPGTPLPGGKATLPINWDLFTNLVLGLINTPVFHNFMGTLDASGKAQATFDTLGPVPGSAGLMLSFAYGLSSPWDFASNGVNIEIIP